jgi:hypothetical protein
MQPLNIKEVEVILPITPNSTLRNEIQLANKPPNEVEVIPARFNPMKLIKFLQKTEDDIIFATVKLVILGALTTNSIIGEVFGIVPSPASANFWLKFALVIFCPA